MFHRKISNKKLNHFFFYVSIIGLIFIVITLYRYRNQALEEDYKDLYENLENQKELHEKPVDDRQNIITQPTPPTEEEQKSPNFLDLRELSIPAIKTYVSRSLEGAIKSVRPDTMGPPGNKGPKGEKGDSGGIHTNQGPLRSVSKPNLFLGRDVNLSGPSQLKLQNRTYMPDQSWIHSSDGKIISVYNKNDCLSASDDGKLQVSNCHTSGSWSYLGTSAQLQYIKPIGGNQKCLSLKNLPENGKEGQFSLSLENCMVGPDQAWSFY